MDKHVLDFLKSLADKVSENRENDVSYENNVFKIIHARSATVIVNGVLMKAEAFHFVYKPQNINFDGFKLTNEEWYIRSNGQYKNLFDIYCHCIISVAREFGLRP